MASAATKRLSNPRANNFILGSLEIHIIGMSSLLYPFKSESMCSVEKLIIAKMSMQRSYDAWLEAKKLGTSTDPSSSSAAEQRFSYTFVDLERKVDDSIFVAVGARSSVSRRGRAN